jgi:hypothetical protein
MSAQNDFALTIDRAAGLALDATCAARSAGAGPLPAPHRRILSSAILALEKAQMALYEARNDPWDQAPNAQALSHLDRSRQLALM